MSRLKGTRLKGVRNRVKNILDEYPLTRSDDDYLFIKYVEIYYPYLAKMPLKEAFLKREIPYYE